MTNLKLYYKPKVVMLNFSAGFCFAVQALFPFKNWMCFMSCLWILDIAWMDSPRIPKPIWLGPK